MGMNRYTGVNWSTTTTKWAFTGISDFGKKKPTIDINY